MLNFKRYLLLICTLLIGVEIFAQNKIKGSKINVLYNDEFTGFSILDSTLKNKRLVMTGENHTYAAFNSRTELKFLKYLHYQSNFNHFIIELGSTRARYMNRYLQTGDSVANAYLSTTTDPEYMLFLYRLRNFNQTLSPEQQITVHGIDAERFSDLLLLQLSEIFCDSTNIPVKLLDLQKALKKNRSALTLDFVNYAYDNENYYEVERNYQKNGYVNEIYDVANVKDYLHFIDSNRTSIQNWLNPASYALLLETEKSMKEFVHYKSIENTFVEYNWREEIIANNLKKLLEENKTWKFYGQFGRCHIAKKEQNGDCGWYGYKSTIFRLINSDSDLKNQSLSIGIFYNSNNLGINDNFYHHESDTLAQEVKKLFKKTDLNSVQLFAIPPSLPNLYSRYQFAIIKSEFTVQKKYIITESDTEFTAENLKQYEKKIEINNLHIGFGLNKSDNLKTISEYYKNNAVSTHSVPAFLGNVQFGSEIRNRRFGIYYQYQFTPKVKIGSGSGHNHYFRQNCFSMDLELPLWNKNTNSLMLFGGIGYGRQVLISKDSQIYFQKNTINNTMRFHNASFLFQYGIKLQKNIIKNAFGIMLAAGYTKDNSKPQWKSEGKAIQTNLIVLQQYPFLNFTLWFRN